MSYKNYYNDSIGRIIFNKNKNIIINFSEKKTRTLNYEKEKLCIIVQHVKGQRKRFTII